MYILGEPGRFSEALWHSLVGPLSSLLVPGLNQRRIRIRLLGLVAVQVYTPNVYVYRIFNYE